MVTTNINVRDMAKITGHPIADFLALFSILISSPLIAGLSSPDYYIVRKPSSLEKDIFSIPILFSICVIVLYVLNLQQGFYYILLVMLASRSADEALMKMTRHALEKCLSATRKASYWAL